MAAELAVRTFESNRWRLLAVVPAVLLVGAVALFVAYGGSLTGLLGRTPPSADVFEIRRVQFQPGEIRIRVTNPQPEELTVGSVAVDDAIVSFAVEGRRTLERLRSATIVVPYDWVADEPITVGVTSSSGIETTLAIAAAVETPEPTPGGFLGYAIVGALVGIVPVTLGLLWLPSLRRAAPQWLAAFMALTAGLLTFLALDALGEALDLQATLPSALGGAGLVLLGFSISFLTLTVISERFAVRNEGGRVLGGVALATLVALGIGLHNFGEGLAIGSSFALGELALGTFLIVGFMVHNVTEGLGIAAPVADGGVTPGLRPLAILALLAGAPAIPGAWLGGFLTSDWLGVIFFAAAAGAAAEVVVEVGRYAARKTPGGLGSPYVLGGFLAGVAVMYATGILAG